MKRMFVVSLLALAMSCGDGSTSITSICDGRDGVALWVAAQVPAERLEAGEQVLYDNGAYFLLVDGRCRYWVASRTDVWAEVHTGVLEPSEADHLSAEFHYGAWSTLAGDYSPPPDEPVFDAPKLVFSNGIVRGSCYGPCGGAQVPAEVVELRTRVGEWIDRLYASGQPVNGALQLTAVRFEEPPLYSVTSQAWTYAEPLASLATSEFDAARQDFGVGHRIDGPTAAALRQLRSAYRRGDFGEFWYRYLPFTDEQSILHRVYVRDTLPYEGADGLIPLPL